ncbi:MAG: efflux RND transporter periplasmic adaptor subunit [Candidatus Nucleicultricaceae bacterium]
MTRQTLFKKNNNSPANTVFSIGSVNVSFKTLLWTGIVLLALIVLTIGFAPRGKNKKETPNPLVAITHPMRESVDVFLDALGTVSAGQSITLKNQVDGILTKIYFKEGQFVKEGDALFEIEPAPFQAQLQQYEGQLLKDKALLETARLDLKRYETLLKQDSISKQVYDTQKSLVKQYEGTVQADQALVDQAKINYNYCFIKAPASGYIGLQTVDAGNFVRSQDTTGLAIINKVDPISVLFSLPEDQLPRVLEKHQNGLSLEVLAYDRTEGTRLATTKTIVIDNQIDPTTGTIKLKGHFENSGQKLFPNQFVAIRLKVDTLHQALTVPTQAIQYSVDGTYIYCYNQNQGQVSKRFVKIGPQKGASTVVLSGVTPEDAIITEGIDKLKESDKVSVAPATTAQSPNTSPEREQRKNA